MTTGREIFVKLEYLPDSSFFIWGKELEDVPDWESPHAFQPAAGSEKQEERPLTPVELGMLLFAWDPRSAYGTLCEVGHWEGKDGIRMSAYDALDYFTHDYMNQQVLMHWPDEVVALRAAAHEISRALKEGRFLPDFARWRNQQLSFKLTGYDESVQSQVSYFADWVNQIILGKITTDAQVAAAWAEVVQAHPSVLAQAQATPIPVEVWEEDEEWLEAVGLRTNPTPFQVGIQLSEPTQGESWSLNVVLRATDGQGVTYLASEEQNEPMNPEWVGYSGAVEKFVRRCLRLLPWLADPVELGTIRRKLETEEALDFLSDGAARLIEAGYFVLLPDWWEEARRLRARLKAKVKSSVGARGQSLFGLAQIVQFDWTASIGDVQLSAEEFAALLAQRRRLVQVRGRWLVLDAAFYEESLRKMKQVHKAGGLTLRDVIEMHLVQSQWLAGASGQEPEPYGAVGTEAEPGTSGAQPPLAVDVELNDGLTSLLAQLQNVATMEVLPEPSTFQGKLRPYQRVGYSWLAFLHRFGFGACLADDMGLGKTVQYISYLLHVKAPLADLDVEAGETTPAEAPALLICPTSVIGNWEKELQRFAPSLRVYLHYGSNRLHGQEFEDNARRGQLVLTTYGLTNLDAADLGRVRWDSVCLDEAQNIKNAYTKQAVAIRNLEARQRIAMTGTPIENRLTELWSIFDFLNPGYLGSLNLFRQRFVNPIERTHDESVIGLMQRLVQPFLLRREKRDPAVELDLPEKTEAKLYVPLTAEQAALYEAALQEMLVKLDSLSPMERRGAILSTLTKLKQICDHPAVYLKERTKTDDIDDVLQGQLQDLRQRSEKLERLVEMVAELRAEGDKCLVFTQFVETGRLLQDVLAHELGEEILFLHGGVTKSKRDEMIARFQAEPSPAVQAEEEGSHHLRSGGVNKADSPAVFILSLKAGGVGLNLTAANHVFHFDRWWNPAVENQATDRAYRIGQHRHVQVHKFVALGTLEERIDEMIETKQSLSNQIVGAGENWITELSTDDLKSLFALRREWVEE